MNSDIVVVLHKVSASPVLATVEGRKLSLTELEISFEEPKGGSVGGGGKLPSSGGSLYDDSSDDSEYGPTEDEDDSDEESDCDDFDEEYIDWEDDDFDDPGGGGGGGGAGSSPSNNNKFMLVNSLFHSSISYILNFEQDGDDDDEEADVPQEPAEEDGAAEHFGDNPVDTGDKEKCVEESAGQSVLPESITKLDKKQKQDFINNKNDEATSADDCDHDENNSLDLLFGGLFLDSLFRRSTSPEPSAEAAEHFSEPVVSNAVENIISPPNAGLDLPLTSEEIKRNIEMLQLADEEGKLVAVAVTEANRKWNCVYVESIVDIETSNLMRKKISFNVTEPKDVRIFERLPRELLTPEPPRWLRPSLEDDLKAEALIAGYLEAEPEELIFDLEF